MSSPPNTWTVLTASGPCRTSPTGASQPQPLPCFGPVKNSHTWLPLTAAPHIPAPLFSRPCPPLLTLDEKDEEIIEQILDQLDRLEMARCERNTQRVADWVYGLPDFYAPPVPLPVLRASDPEDLSVAGSSSFAFSPSSSEPSPSPSPSSVSSEPMNSSGSWNICSYAPTEGDDSEYSVGDPEAGEEKGKLLSQMRGRLPVKETYRPLRLRSVPLEPPRSRAGRGL